MTSQTHPPRRPGTVSTPGGSVGTLGATLLDDSGVRSLGNEAMTLLYEGVRSQLGCCELARRWSCSANPARLWQLTAEGCVVQRSNYLHAPRTPQHDTASGLAMEIAETAGAAPYGRLYYR